MKPLKRYWTFWLVLGITFLLGIVGFNWGYPNYLVGDEKEHVLAGMNYFLFPESLITTPYYFVFDNGNAYPPLHHIVMGICSLFFFIFEGIKSLFKTASFSEAKSLLYIIGFSSHSGILILGRLTSVGLSVLNVWLTMRIARLLYRDNNIAITAGLWVGVALLSVFQAHYVYPNNLSVALSLATIWALILVAQDPKPKRYIVAAILFALAMNTKWNLLPLLLLFPLAYWGATRSLKLSITSWRCLKPTIVGFILGSIVLVAIFPALVFRWDIISDTFQSMTDVSKSGTLAYTNSFGGYIFSPTPQFDEPLISGSVVLGVGWLVFVLGAAGILYAIRRHRLVEMMLVIWLLAFYFYMESYSIRGIRHMVIIVAPLAILGSKLLWDVFRKSRGPQWAVVTVAVLFALPSLWMSVEYAYSKTLPDTRLIAKEWVETNIPVGSNIQVDFYDPPLKEFEHRMKWLNQHKPHLIPLFHKYFSDQIQEGYRLTPIKPVLDIRQGDIESSSVPSVNDRIMDGAEYIITSSYFKHFFTHPNPRRFYPKYTAKWRKFYSELDRVGERVYRISPQKWWINGPEIVVYKMPSME